MMEMTVLGHGVQLVAYLMFGFSLWTWLFVFVRRHGGFSRKRRGFRPVKTGRQLVMARARWKFAY